MPNESCLDISAIWQHPKFIAGRPELLEQITRATAKRADGQKEGGGKASNGNDSDHEPAEAEGGDKEELTSMQAHLQRLEHSVSEMHQELRAAREYAPRTFAHHPTGPCTHTSKQHAHAHAHTRTCTR